MADKDLLLHRFIEHLKLLVHVARGEWQHRWRFRGIIIEGDDKATCIVRAAKFALDLPLNVYLFLRCGDAVVEVDKIAAPKVITQVVVVEVGDLHVSFNPRQAAKIFGQRVVLDTSGIAAVVEELLADAVLWIKGRDALNVLNLGELADHLFIVPICDLEHLLLLIDTHTLKGYMLHPGDLPGS